MPELPEVETTRLGLWPHLQNRRIERIELFRPALRWPIPTEIHQLTGATIIGLERRAKYLLMHTPQGGALWHLGMSGSLRVCSADTPLKLHDHVSVQLDSGWQMRFHDPRRFGCLLYLAPEPNINPADAFAQNLLAHLGPEPLDTEAFTSEYLFKASRGRKTPVKHFLMDQKTVVGVGNIYAAESLFLAGIRPGRAAQSLSRAECQRLVHQVQAVLSKSIQHGGTTLRDFLNADGEPGYFEQELFVYGREGLPCKVCQTIIKAAQLGTRQSCYCPKCQR